jgi:hypothetical protein
MTAATAHGLIGPGERIGTIMQVKGAVARLRRGGWPLLGLWLGTVAWGQAMQYAARATGIELLQPQITPGYIVYLLVVTAIGAVIGALVLRVTITGRSGWWRMDGRLFAAAGLSGLVSGGIMAINVVYGWALVRASSDGEVWLLFTALAGYGVIILLAAKLTLWPAGVLMGRADVTPARSWRLMKRATRGLVLSYFIFALPITVLTSFVTGLALMEDGLDLRSPAFLVAMQALGAGVSVCGAALTATIYDLRVAAPSSVAEVFA